MAKEKSDRTYPEGGVFNGVIGNTVAESLPAPPVPQARTGQRAEYFGPPFEFTGTIVEVTVDVPGKLIPDAEEESTPELEWRWQVSRSATSSAR